MDSYLNELAGSVEEITISDIVPPANGLRNCVSGIEQLAESIKKIGLLQPIVVRINTLGSFEVVAGNRRFNACKKLGWRKISCHIVELDDKTAFEVSIIENIQRQTLNPVEEGLAFRKYVNKFGWGGVSELAQKLSKSPGYVCKRMKLVELPNDVIELISKSDISVSTAEELLSVKDKYKQSQLAVMISNKQLSSRETRELIKDDLPYTDIDSLFHTYDDHYNCAQARLSKSFDKSIIALRIAIKKLGSIVETVEDDWIFYDILLHHKNMLNSQIDLLIKEKRKFKNKKSLHKLLRLNLYHC
ncbi:MAG TPA: ParB/RepB/Spo0J family partition protein [Nitrososphaeraceae archaeon]|nr:ParB/RepB/Spo0J family partition protein [Nitrososphaeraceae archaeon]